MLLHVIYLSTSLSKIFKFSFSFEFSFKFIGCAIFFINKSPFIFYKNKFNYTLRYLIIKVKSGIFRTTGHMIILTILIEDGEILLNDPNSIINSEKSWDVDTIISEAVSMWEMTSTKNI